LTLPDLFLPETPSLSLLCFNLFPQLQSTLVSSLNSSMQPQSRHRSAFESLIKLLDDLETGTSSGDFLQYIPVFIIPVIQNIQASEALFGDNKQVTLILA